MASSCSCSIIARVWASECPPGDSRSIELKRVSRSSSSISDISVSLSNGWPPRTPSCWERHSCSPRDLACKKKHKEWGLAQSSKTIGDEILPSVRPYIAPRVLSWACGSPWWSDNGPIVSRQENPERNADLQMHPDETWNQDHNLLSRI